MTKREDPDYVDPIRTEHDYRGESRRVLTLNWTTFLMLVVAAVALFSFSFIRSQVAKNTPENQRLCVWLQNVQSTFDPQFAALAGIASTDQTANTFRELIKRETEAYATGYPKANGKYAADLRNISSLLQDARGEFLKGYAKPGNLYLDSANQTIGSLATLCDRVKK
jgi:hypothetical protein